MNDTHYCWLDTSAKVYTINKWGFFNKKHYTAQDAASTLVFLKAKTVIYIYHTVHKLKYHP